VLQRPLQRVEAVLAVVDPDHHRHPPRRRRGRRCFLRHGSLPLGDWLLSCLSSSLLAWIDPLYQVGWTASSLSWVPSLYSTQNQEHEPRRHGIARCV
jgi:hypothetical protein